MVLWYKLSLFGGRVEGACSIYGLACLVGKIWVPESALVTSGRCVFQDPNTHCIPKPLKN